MDKAEFEDIVVKAIEDIPEGFRERVDNLSIEIDEYEIIQSANRDYRNKGKITLALYHGVPMTKRSGKPVFPDKITIYKKAIESVCSSDEEVKKTIKRVVLHEIGHYFGLDEDMLDKLGY